MVRKYVHWEPSCSMRKYRRTDMTKLIVAFRNFTNTSKNVPQLKMIESTYFEIYWGEEERLPSMSSELRCLTLIGPCIVIYFYRETNQMHQFLKFILLWNMPVAVYTVVKLLTMDGKTVRNM